MRVLNPHVEVGMRAVGLFLGTFFTVGFAKGNKIKYDMPLMVVAVILGFLMKYVNLTKIF